MQRELLGLSEIATASGGFSYGGKSTDYASLLILAGVFDTTGAMAGSPSTPQNTKEQFGPGDFARGAL